LATASFVGAAMLTAGAPRVAILAETLVESGTLACSGGAGATTAAGADAVSLAGAASSVA
jgi:hypothetical protein